MDNIQTLTFILMGIFGIMFLLFLGLLGVYYKNRQDQANLEKKDEVPVKNNDPAQVKKTKTYTLENSNKFMEFESIVDNMIVVKSNVKYLMVVECKGINYDLMSEVEKNSVEEGFVQFLNTIRYPIQIYVQTRTVNLNDSIARYEDNVQKIELEFNRAQTEYYNSIKSGRYTKNQRDVAFFELMKDKNLLDYGRDIIINTQRVSMNKNVLNKKYYVIVPYVVDVMTEGGHYSKEERLSMAFSELYTRSQAIIGALSTCEVEGKILNSEQLAELLYMAYNRDEAETYGMDRAIRAGYDELYSTAEDVMDKKIQALDKQIVEEAIQKVDNIITHIRFKNEKTYKERIENKQEYVDAFAEETIINNANKIGRATAMEAVKQIEEEKQKRNGGEA